MVLRVVAHVDEPSRLAQCARSLANLHAAEPEAAIAVVVHGEALPALQSDAAGARELVAAAVDGWLELVACGLTATRTGCAMPEGARRVDSGVAEVVRRQREGWTYLRF